MDGPTVTYRTAVLTANSDDRLSARRYNEQFWLVMMMLCFRVKFSNHVFRFPLANETRPHTNKEKQRKESAVKLSLLSRRL
jgi:hypothetical protein